MVTNEACTPLGLGVSLCPTCIYARHTVVFDIRTTLARQLRQESQKNFFSFAFAHVNTSWTHLQTLRMC